MESEFVGKEIRNAEEIAEGLRAEGFMLENIEEEIATFERKYKNDSTSSTKAELLARYILLCQWLPVGSSDTGITIRERFQQLFPEHFSIFMKKLNVSATSTRWSGCLLCKHNLGHGCEKGLQPQRLPGGLPGKARRFAGS